ncbi:MAG: hypothetical protein V4692_14390 [Bdellovibrionota bacterium]
MTSKLFVTLAIGLFSQLASAGSTTVATCMTTERTPGVPEIMAFIGRETKQGNPWGNPEAGPSIVNPVKLQVRGAGTTPYDGAGVVNPLEISLTLNEGGDMALGSIEAKGETPHKLTGTLRVSGLKNNKAIPIFCHTSDQAETLGIALLKKIMNGYILPSVCVKGDIVAGTHGTHWAQPMLVSTGTTSNFPEKTNVLAKDDKTVELGNRVAKIKTDGQYKYFKTEGKIQGEDADFCVTVTGPVLE